MRRPRLRLPDWLLWILRLAIAVTFIYAGVTKFIAPVRFASDIANYHLLPWWASVRMAFYLPWLEIVCGIALVSVWLERGALLILLMLSAVFVGALTSARIRGIDISCGCFGHALPDLSFASHLALNFGIMAAVVLVLLGGQSRSAMQPRR